MLIGIRYSFFTSPRDATTEFNPNPNPIMYGKTRYRNWLTKTSIATLLGLIQDGADASEMEEKEDRNSIPALAPDDWPGSRKDSYTKGHLEA